MAERNASLAELGLTAKGGREASITGLAVDSRAVKPGFLFAALPGSKGHEYWQRDFTGSSGLFSFVLKKRLNDAGDLLQVTHGDFSIGGLADHQMGIGKGGDRRRHVRQAGQRLGHLRRGLHRDERHGDDRQ